MNRNQMLQAMKEDVDRLTQPFRHVEKTDNGTLFVGHHLSLFDQFRLEITESTVNKAENGPKMPAGSKPPIAEKHLELMIYIKKTLRDLALLTCGRTARYHEETLGDILTACLRLDEVTIRVCYENISEIRKRLDQMLTWDIAPRKLTGQCPVCGSKNKLLVYMDNHGPVYAICNHCHSRWDREVLGILAGSLETGNTDNDKQ